MIKCPYCFGIGLTTKSWNYPSCVLQQCLACLGTKVITQVRMEEFERQASESPVCLICNGTNRRLHKYDRGEEAYSINCQFISQKHHTRPTHRGNNMKFRRKTTVEARRSGSGWIVVDGGVTSQIGDSRFREIFEPVDDEAIKELKKTTIVVLGGKPTIQGTDITVEMVLEKLAFGDSLSQICRAYVITLDQAGAAIDFAADQVRKIVVP